MQTFSSLANGNIGAMNFLMALGHPEVPVRTLGKVQNSGIIGTDLYVLWSDLCERDIKKVIQLMDNCPLDILKDACSRQDYSGRQLISEYIKQPDEPTQTP